MITKIVILPRSHIERVIEKALKPKDIEGDWALISIYNDKRLLDFKEIDILKSIGCVETLSLRFADITKDNYEKAKDYYEEKDIRLFSSDQASQTIAFLNTIQTNDSIKTLVVHCAAGVSRSGAVGLFASRYLHTDDDEFWEINPYIHPNSHVLDLLLAASGMKDDYARFWEKITVDPNLPIF